MEPRARVLHWQVGKLGRLVRLVRQSSRAEEQSRDGDYLLAWFCMRSRPASQKVKSWLTNRRVGFVMLSVAVAVVGCGWVLIGMLFGPINMTSNWSMYDMWRREEERKIHRRKKKNTTLKYITRRNIFREVFYTYMAGVLKRSEIHTYSSDFHSRQSPVASYQSPVAENICSGAEVDRPSHRITEPARPDRPG